MLHWCSEETNMAPLALYIFALLPVHLAWWYRHFLLNFTTFWVIFLTCMGGDFSLCYFALSCPAHVAWLACSSRPALLICWGGGASSELSYTLLSSSNSEKFIHLLVSELCSIIKLLWPGSGQSVKSLFVIIHASASPCASNVKQLCLFEHCQLNPLGKTVQPPFNHLSQAQKLSPHQYFSLSYLLATPDLNTLIHQFRCSPLFIHPISNQQPCWHLQ